MGEWDFSLICVKACGIIDGVVEKIEHELLSNCWMHKSVRMFMRWLYFDLTTLIAN